MSKIKNEKVKILFREKNDGKGANIKNALKEDEGDLILFQDADLEYNINSYLEKDKINIQQILLKRKEAQKPLININEDEDYIVKKKQEEFTTNINIKDIF